MIDKNINAIEVALNDLNKTAKKLIIIPEGEVTSQTKTAVVELKSNFDVKSALALIGNVKCIGIVNSDMFYTSSITELINIITTKNRATVVSLSSVPISCKIFLPIPKVGTKHISGNYEYSYGEELGNDGEWLGLDSQMGWGVKIRDKTKTDYACPLTTVQTQPVVNMAGLFRNNPAMTINLIDWDTSNITNMKNMFDCCRATSINGLDNFNTSKVTDMQCMFQGSQVTSLDLSSFDTSNASNMRAMFSMSQVESLDVSGFNTSNVANMSWMFHATLMTNLNLSNFDTSSVENMSGMFSTSLVKTLDLTSFNTSNVMDMSCMFNSSFAQELSLTSFDTSNVTDIEGMFFSTVMTNLDLSSFDICQIESKKRDNLFYGSNIRTLTAKTHENANVFKEILKSTNPAATVIVDGVSTP